MKNKKESRPRNWHYVTRKPITVLVIYCLAAVIAGMGTGAAAIGCEAGKTVAGGIYLGLYFFWMRFVEDYYDGLDGIPYLLLRGFGFCAQILGAAYIIVGAALIFR